MMSIDLPPPVDLYVKIENSGEVEALSGCFALNATVRDEGHTYEGLAAIKEWKAETKKKYNHTIHPLEVTHRDGKTVLKAGLTGNFPGSPVTVAERYIRRASLGVANCSQGQAVHAPRSARSFGDLIGKFDEHIAVVSAAGWCRRALHHAAS